LNHRRCRIFAGSCALERVAAGLYLPVQIACSAAGAAKLVELIVMRFELLVGHAPVLNAEIVIGDGFLAIVLLIVALGQEIGRQKAPDLAVPMHAAAADAGAEQEGAEAAH